MNANAVQINETADRIADVIEFDLAAKPNDGRPLYVLLGEEHATSAHYLASMRIMQTVMDRGHRIACAIEWPYNHMSVIFNQKAQSLTPAKVNQSLRYLRAVACDHPVHLQSMTGHWNFVDAEVANTLRARFLLDRNISARYNDAAQWDGASLWINHYDPVFQAIIGHGEQNHSPIHSTERTGIYLRNIIMRNLAMEHAAMVRPEVYFQICGATHVAGNIKNRHPFEESLIPLFSAAGQHVRAVTFFSALLPEQALNSPFLLKGQDIHGPCFIHREGAEDAYLQETAPQILSRMIGHGLMDFKMDCKRKTGAFFQSVAGVHPASPQAFLFRL
ncbi:MAG TPA: hypothetical protein VIF12_08255 [Micavibrio sp.]